MREQSAGEAREGVDGWGGEGSGWLSEVEEPQLLHCYESLEYYTICRHLRKALVPSRQSQGEEPLKRLNYYTTKANYSKLP